MSILGIGTDIVQIKRIELTYKRYKEKFINRIFTPLEREKAQLLSFNQQINFYAKRYAGKEAVSKALGTGMGRLASWQEIEITNDSSGAPTVTLTGQTAQTLLEKAAGKKTHIHLSLSDDLNAMAFVIIEIL